MKRRLDLLTMAVALIFVLLGFLPEFRSLVHPVQASESYVPWEFRRVFVRGENTLKLDRLCEMGWEPFDTDTDPRNVSYYVVYLKRQKR